MNVLDSERIGDILCEAGWEPAENEEQADVVIFNTCCVRASAENRAIGRLTLLKPWRSEKKDRRLALCGCIAQKDGQTLLDRFPFLDLVVGARDFHRLPGLVEYTLQTGERVAETAGITSSRPAIPTPRSPRGVTSFVTIMYGCDNFCSYCIVPMVRGREHSRPKHEIISEIQSLVEKGVKEVTLLGQNVNSYRDPDSGMDFPDLLEAVNGVSGLDRIRYTTSHPKDASEKLIRAVSRLTRVCENFHIPAQAGSDSVLQGMKRGYTRGNYLDLVRKIRRAVPGAVITTDLMVGFPGETREDFEQTLDLCRKVRFDAAFMFVYSVRPGTAAAELPDDVSPEEKKRRIQELITLQEEISTEKNSQMEGRTVEVLVEAPASRGDGMMAGKERGGRTVVFHANPHVVGKIVKVRVARSTPHTLIGEIETRKDAVSSLDMAQTQEYR